MSSLMRSDSRRCGARARARRRQRLCRHVRRRARDVARRPGGAGRAGRAGRAPELGDAERARLGAAAARGLRVAVPALARDDVRRPPVALARRRCGVRDPVAGARRDQQDRVELRPQHGPELGRRGRLDAVHAGHVAALGHRRKRRRRRRSVEPRRRRLLGRALPRGGRRPHRHLPRDLRLQPRAVVRRRRAAHWRRCSAALRTATPSSSSTASGSRSRRRRRRSRRSARRSAPRRSAQSELQIPADAARAEAQDLSLLLSDRLVAEKTAFEAEQAHDAATAEVERLRAELELAEATLESAQSGAHSASFVPAAADMLGMPSRADGYVFPVGGGPALVSVGHHHHDYPAADIAAPLGTPVYALADALVESLADGGRCGIGLTLRTVDGLKWIYCHLSHRDSAVQPGAFLTAGQWVGLVGSTGNSTGPHLHLGLTPGPLPAGDAVVPGVRGHRVHLAGRGSSVGLAAGPGFRPDSVS